MQGATQPELILPIPLMVSIHAPYAGSDDREIGLKLTQDVSIHAPYAGSDVIVFVQLLRAVVFQSTPPMQGAT